jgi:hypothetical protein
MEVRFEKLLTDLHKDLLKANEYDEGDLIYYRIDYRLADALQISKQEAAKLHSEYHERNPRKASQGFCDTCQKVVSIIPIIYGMQASDLLEMRDRENAGRLIIGDTGTIRQGARVAMFGCKECKGPLPKYGTL